MIITFDHLAEALLSQHGFQDILDARGTNGWLTLTQPEAFALIARLEAAFLSVPKTSQKRFRAIIGGIRNTIGPEGWAGI